MIWISNKNQLRAEQDKIDHFFLLYEDSSNFPDPNEREDPVHIKGRIESASINPFTQILINPNADSSNEVTGGAVLEYYPNSQCALLTYIFVHPDERAKGIAKNMILNPEGLKKGIQLAETQLGKKINAVFFEANNPDLTDTSTDSISPNGRLEFFRKVGAKILDMPYIQPPLDENKKSVHNLLLLCFSDFCNLEDGFNSEIFFEFYKELCTALNANKNIYPLEREVFMDYMLSRYKSSSKIYFK